MPNTESPRIPDHEILRLIGRGSYGEVWLARNALGTLRAVKVVRRSSFDSDRPYQREFSGIKKFEPVSRSHDGMVDILQVGKNEAPEFFYYVMELADDASAPVSASSNGEESTTFFRHSIESYQAHTLTSEIKRVGRLTAARALPLFSDLAVAVGHLHARGLLHRDVKPANVIFVGGIPKLADIGLVTEAGGSGTFVGTMGFIPPEGPGTVGADLYALGKLMYECVTGRDRQDFPTLVLDPANPLENAALIEINEVLLRCCDPDPSKRYQNAAELKADLAVLLSGRSVQRLRSNERNFLHARRFGIAASLAAAVAIATSVFLRQQERTAHANFERSEDLRRRAVEAEKTANERLYAALLARASAERRSGSGGARGVALSTIRQAAQLHPATAELRSEAIAAMALADFPERKRWKAETTNWMPICMSPDAQLIAKAMPDLSVEILRVDNDRVLLSIKGVTNQIEWLGPFSTDNRFLVGTGGGTHYVWDLGKNALRGLLERDAAWKYISFLPGSHTLIYSNGSTIWKWSLDTNERKVYAFTNFFEHIMLTGDGSRFATTGQSEPGISIRDFPSGRLLQKLFLPEQAHVMSLRWNSSDSGILAGGADQKLYSWDLMPGTNTLSSNGPVALEFTGHGAEVVTTAQNPTGDLIVTSSWDETTRLWGLTERRELASLPGTSWVCRFSDDGQYLSKYDRLTRELVLLEVHAHDYCQLLSEPGALAVKSPNQTAFTTDSQWLLSACNDGIRTYRVSDGKPGPVQYAPPTIEFVMLPDRLNRFHAMTTAGRFAMDWRVSPNGEFEISNRTRITPAQTAADLNGVSPWFARHGSLFQILRPDGTAYDLEKSDGAVDFEFAPYGHYIAAAFGDHHAAYWELKPGAPIHELGQVRNNSIAISPDSRSVYHASYLNLCRTEASTGIQSWTTSITDVECPDGDVKVSPDGKTVAVLSTRYQIALIDADSGHILAKVEHPFPRMITSIAFSPNGEYLAATCRTHVTQLWNLKAIRSVLATMNLDW